MKDLYRGRFAPTPSGNLHFGSLIAALGSFLEAHTHGGKWFVRIDDLDAQRVQPGSIDHILRTLEGYGLHWDGSVEFHNVVYQSERYPTYLEALEKIKALGLVYECVCSRKEIISIAKKGKGGAIYSGTCRYLKNQAKDVRSLRVRTDKTNLMWRDQLFGEQNENLEEDIGDFVLWRGDGVCSYHLAVVVDDYAQGITSIVRGQDLMDTTSRQIHIQKILGYPQPDYFHLPTVVNKNGDKLSKQTHAPTLLIQQAPKELINALIFLEQKPPNDLKNEEVSTIIQWAIENWKPKQIKPQMKKKTFLESKVP